MSNICCCHLFNCSRILQFGAHSRYDKDVLTQKLNSTKKNADIGEGGVKNPEKLPTSFMDDPKGQNSGFYNVIKKIVTHSKCLYKKQKFKKGAKSKRFVVRVIFKNQFKNYLPFF